MLLVPGEVIQGHHRYAVDTVVGTGAYACVYRATDELGRLVALKEYFPPSHPREIANLKNLFERERFILTQVSPHPQVPTFYEGFIADNQYYIAQEFIAGRSLDEVIRAEKQISREWMIKWAISLCEALSYMHNRQIVHHDLKPPNIRITPENHLKLLDYGAAIYLGKMDETVPESMHNETELFGTEGYLPPEVEETFKADIRTDIFALGCILYELVMGEPPEQQSINERNLYVTTPLMQRKDVDLSFVKLVTTALSYNTEFRYANAGMFAAELRKIAQAMLFVTAKSIYFGNVDLGTATSQKFRMFNGGGKGDLVGEIKPKVPWIRIEVPGFRTQKRDVVLIADTTKVPRRNQVVRGQVEIVTKDVVNEDGEMLARADRWTVDCYITVNAKSAKLVAVDAAGKAVNLDVHVRLGQTARLNFTLRNDGEMTSEGTLEIAGDPTEIVVGPDMFRLKPAASVALVVVVPPFPGATAGEHREIIIEAREDGKAVAAIPIQYHVEGTFDFVKGLFSRKMSRKLEQRPPDDAAPPSADPKT
ncbi:MAG: serine/threonine-protein kinase [Capsulimonadaceae bacterium]|nr:serine/threonine-protein kinase [Capsulimonadaceae bacterium]